MHLSNMGSGYFMLANNKADGLVPQSRGQAGLGCYLPMAAALLCTRSKVEEVSLMPNRPSPPPSPSGPT